jgi:hypothetical protein
MQERWPFLYLPLKGGGVGGLRPPFLAQRTPMRSIGYGAKLAGWGSLQAREIDPLPNASRSTSPFQGEVKSRSRLCEGQP